MFVFLFCVALSLTSCKITQKTQDKIVIDKVFYAKKKLAASSKFSSCENQSSWRLNGVLLNNNLWGASRVKKGVAHLCVYQTDSTWAWVWDVPAKSRGVIGYPAVKVNAKTHPDSFPVKVGSIADLEVNYTMQTFVNSHKYNLAFDLWLGQVSPHRKTSTEIMVWEEAQDFNSYGKEIDEIETSFGTYTVKAKYLKNETFKQDWMYIGFIRKNHRQKGRVNVQELLEYLVRKQLISADEYLFSIELGNEIGNSTGYTTLKRFDWSMEKK